MLRKTFYLAVAALLAALTTTTPAQAWAAYHRGYTHVSPNGNVQHYGTTRGYGGYGGYGGYSHYDTTGGAYGGGYHYGTTGAYGGYHYGAYSAPTAGVYRAW